MSEHKNVQKKSHELPIKKGDLISELHGKFVSTTIRDVLPDGIKLEINSQGQVTGKYAAGHMETTTILQKMDGSADWESKAMEVTPQGDVVVVTGKGHGSASDPGSIKWDGEIKYMTMPPRLSWLNGKKVWAEGSGNQATGEVQIKAYEMI